MAYTTIDDPSAYFQTELYTGNSSTNAITFSGNSDMQPDLVWGKRRDAAYTHRVWDSSRGVTKYLTTAGTDAEATYGYVSSFDTDGVTFGLYDQSVNVSGGSYVLWNWKANGGTTSSNTNGTITSTVQANTDAGFSIGTFTGNWTSGATVGHGLGVKPDMLILKSRNNPSGAAMNWVVAHKGLDNMAGLSAIFLNGTNAKLTGSAYWGNAAPTTSVFTVGDNAAVNYTGNNMLFYAFAEKQGYSKFGKYTGNGSTNGAFVYTGFRPAFVMVKRTNATENWAIIDSTRDPYNLATKFLRPDETSAETAGNAANMDLLSNGFKLRNTDTKSNASSSTYIYMAFAENPFVTSTGIPTTAR